MRSIKKKILRNSQIEINEFNDYRYIYFTIKSAIRQYISEKNFIFLIKNSEAIAEKGSLYFSIVYKHNNI